MSKFRFKGRIQPPTGNPEFDTPAPFRVCPGCGGKKVISITSANYEGYAKDITCPTCHGTGCIPIWYTIEQWEELTGRKVPGEMPIWVLSPLTKEWTIDTWDNCSRNKATVVIATEAGCPPKSWRPE